MGKTVSLTEFREGGGFEGPLTLLSARFEDFDFNKKASPTTGLVLRLVGESGKVFTKFYGVGNPQKGSKKFVAIDDGAKIESVGKDENLHNSCKTALLIRELLSCGFDQDALEDCNVTVLDGLHAEWVNKTLGELTGDKGDNKDAEVLVPTEIFLNPEDDDTDEHARFEEKKGAATKATKKGATKKKATSKKSTKKAEPEEDGDDGDVAEAAAEVVMGILTETEEGSISKTALAGKVFAATKDHAQKKAVIAMAMNADFLKGLDGIEFDGKTLSIG